MNSVIRLERRSGVDISYHQTSIEPLNSVGRIGKEGIDKTYTLERVIELANEVNANIIIRSGRNAKWYLKRFPYNEIDERIEKQMRFRRESCRLYSMWIIHWE